MKMKRIILIMAVMLVFTGCGNTGSTKQGNEEVTNSEANNTEETSGTTAEGFTFEYNEVSIPMNVDAAPVVEALGESVDYFEAASCAFQGLDKIYSYNGFELGTYPNGDKDYVSYVTLLDDSVSTDKGVYVGSALEEVTTAYGKEYTVEGSSYVYRLGESKMSFIIEEDTVTQITYSAIVEGLNN
ncbi:MAG: hypothetical protein K0R34_3922 [Herbinix sp.]|jgi:uncharacterized protein YceK|nr:hypothetical protein [Herbinix sp.]